MSREISSFGQTGALKRILGFGRGETTAGIEPAANAASNASAESDLAATRRRALLDRIASFHLDNGLDISSVSLLAALSAFSGAEPRLARRIDWQRAQGLPITREWLAEVTEPAAENSDTHATLDQIVDNLNRQIEGFSTTTRAARSSTGEYGKALEHQITELSMPTMAANDMSTERMIASLASIAKVMLDRTRQVEDEIRRSEAEATALRKRLDRARRDAEIDHMTGLPNRRAFEGLLELHYREAQATIEPLSVAFCDIDHFKRVNDTHGHEAGDRVIRAVAQALNRIADANCHVARHGGEEFVILFRGLDRHAAFARLDAARAEMASRHFINRKSETPIGTITFSGGVADVFAFPEPRAALEAADEALYRAKQEGRNRICLAAH